MRTYAIEKKMSFCAAHMLDLDDNHPCSTIHGHQYQVSLRIEANKLSKEGFVIDFNHLKDFKKDFIDDKLDHSTLFTRKMYNELDDDIKQFFKKVYILPTARNTSVEILARHIHNKLIIYLAAIDFNDFTKIVVRVSETDNNVGEYTESDNVDINEDLISEDRKGNILKHFEKIKNKMKDNELLTEQVNILSERIDFLKDKAEENEEIVDELRTRVDEQEETVEELCRRVDEQEETVEDLETLLKDAQQSIVDVEDNTEDLEDRIEDLENRIEELEQIMEIEDEDSE